MTDTAEHSYFGPLPPRLVHKLISHANGCLSVFEFDLEDKKARQLADLCRWAKDNKKICVSEYGFAFPEIVEALRKQMAKRLAAKECGLTLMQRMNARRESIEVMRKRLDGKYKRNWRG